MNMPNNLTVNTCRYTEFNNIQGPPYIQIVTFYKNLTCVDTVQFFFSSHDS